MPSEWRIEKAAAEQEHFVKYGWLPGDEWHEDTAPGKEFHEVDGSWMEVAGEWRNLGDSWDYPDPLVQ